MAVTTTHTAQVIDLAKHRAAREFNRALLEVKTRSLRRRKATKQAQKAQAIRLAAKLAL